ncbi:hypothetical protein RCO28_18775 [Streptomyces sp. LHD-70]|uniref:hypothetical protein n=1 Tax=Streptomyces sp. LHD-70 TaxID=3072140 RepID=UPI00280E6109|nr:hypothetical protein [Streptomyces sp. LHD-70]MDQ8704517.1 hypothetical protein [Streptomyces sp. LHD-70]
MTATNGNTLITITFNRPVEAGELRPGDTFSLDTAPRTPLVVRWVENLEVAPDVQLVAIALPGAGPRLHLPRRTTVRMHRMVRTITMKCLLCEAPETLDIDLPVDGEPLSLVCQRHVPPDLAEGEGEVDE